MQEGIGLIAIRAFGRGVEEEVDAAAGPLEVGRVDVQWRVPVIPYREFCYPLNVFMHILSREEKRVRRLHYGLFEDGDDRIADAQERSTSLLVEHLPPPPARILEVGAGLGTTLAFLLAVGHD